MFASGPLLPKFVSEAPHGITNFGSGALQRGSVMNFHQHDHGAQSFGIGQPVLRKEDPMLMRGEGRFTDDLSLLHQAHAVMVRSPVAHGVIRGIDATTARMMPGVLEVFTGADLTA